MAEWILADGLPVRLGLQLHKFIWDPAMHGVPAADRRYMRPKTPVHFYNQWDLHS